MSRDEFDTACNELRNLTIKLSWMKNHDNSGSLDIAYGKLLETQRELNKVFNLHERTGWER